jgi:hypothetical protein
MTDAIATSSSPQRWRAILETLLIFAVFSLHGAWPVPDVNEAHYLSKAKHYWNPEWCHDDFFVNTADAHQVFYWTLGWLTRLLPLPAVAWVGRLLTWALLAYAWRRLSWAVLPQAWLAVLGAVLFVSLNENAHMAGEWIVGGVEAKGFAYVLVLLGIEAVVRARWNRAWLLLGAATGMHAVVGGWSLVAAGVAWLAGRRERPAWKAMLPGLLGGFLLALPGVWFALALTRGVDPQTVVEANSIYVWQRLPHHLAADRFQIGFPSRHMLLWTLWLVLITVSVADGPRRRLRWMVSAAMLLTAIGYGFVLIGHWNPDFAASLLRFYWFRMSDVFVPLGVTLVGLDWLRQMTTNTGARGDAETRKRQARKAPTGESRTGKADPFLPLPSPLAGEGPGVRGLRAARLWMAGLILVAIGDLALQFEHLPAELACCGLPSVPPRADKGVVYDDWRDVCRWAAANTDSDALFLTPRMASTFRWYANRGEVVSWKDIPQNADGIVEWWRRLGDIWGVGTPAGPIDSLALLGPKRLAELAGNYKAEYAIVQLLPNEARLPLKAAYENGSYAVYRLSVPAK